MRLFNTTLVVLAAVLFASGAVVSKADQTSVSNVDVAHSSRVLAGEDKRFLRSHLTTDDEDKLPEHDEEERKFGANMFAALKLQRMKDDDIYRLKVFKRWKDYRKTVDEVAVDVPKSLAVKYATFLRMYK
ncbi:hypothetical protein PHYBOEH_002248 [Phytophthora boehmeriae]|uniref:RxLR effector protein n=1 Tax=Phytophthora boehmeriae TaxID=109152 RepID=A0A8T1V301_9STRA|nr:hypothetical protein PHYBOEH_002248 [Phytophthora boehmeriae]